MKIEPPLESKQQRNNSYKNSLPRSRFLDVTQRRHDRIKIARAQCTAVILFDFSSFVRQTSGKKSPCLKVNKNALDSVESRLFVDNIRSEEANRARAFVTRGWGGRPSYKRAWDARRLA